MPDGKVFVQGAKPREIKWDQRFATDTCRFVRNIKTPLDRRRFYDKLMKTGKLPVVFRRSSMSIQSHLVELERRHQALEREIQGEQIHPSASDVKLRELKRKKLYLKQEIEKLKIKTVSPVLH
jgi:hypothetical protein